MRALTVMQPYASAIIHWGKSLENRSWRPPLSAVGERIAITASAKRPGLYDVQHALSLAAPGTVADRLPLGVVVGTVIVLGHVATPDQARGWVGDAAVWWCGPLAWVLGEPRPLKRPVPCKGALGLWTLPADVVAAMEER